MTVNADGNPGTFDEARALEQLEHLHAQILQARAARRRVEEQFDAFVQGFRSERHAAAEADEPEQVAAPAAPPRAEGVPVAATAPLAEPLAVPDVSPSAPYVAVRPAPVRRRRARAAVVIVLGTLAVGVFAVAVRGRRVPPVTQPARPAASTAKPAQDATIPPVAAQASPAQPGVNLELITRRRVWVRVTIDGRRAFERELAADQRIPLHGDRAILIRAGDAGAVALTRDGRDAGLLGRDGMVATREFTVDR